jgi:hypothetical protein
MGYPALHNADMDMKDSEHNAIPGEWRNTGELQDLAYHLVRNRDNAEGKKVNDYIKNYFNCPAGSIPWQKKMVSAKHIEFSKFYCCYDISLTFELFIATVYV